MRRQFLTIAETSDEDLARIYALSTASGGEGVLDGDDVALVFERPSLRTRASSSTAVTELGGHPTFFSDEEIGMDVRESAEDIARTIAQMFSVAALRLRRHTCFARMRDATSGELSLINLLSDVAHPTQAVADVLTLADEFGAGDLASLAERRIAYVGDATNVTRSLAAALLRLGADVVVAAPAGYQLTDGTDEDPIEVARTSPGRLTLTDDPYEAVRHADAIYTDAWVSMGLEDETAARRRDLAAFKLDESLLSAAAPHAVVLHCLPAHRGDEITDEVLDGPASRVWRQVYHRRSAMRGVLRWMKEGR